MKGMEAVESLEGSREALLGVWGAERSEGDGGGWGGLPGVMVGRLRGRSLPAGAAVSQVEHK